MHVCDKKTDTRTETVIGTATEKEQRQKQGQAQRKGQKKTKIQRQPRTVTGIDTEALNLKATKIVQYIKRL